MKRRRVATEETDHESPNTKLFVPNATLPNQAVRFDQLGQGAQSIVFAEVSLSSPVTAVPVRPIFGVIFYDPVWFDVAVDRSYILVPNPGLYRCIISGTAYNATDAATLRASIVPVVNGTPYAVSSQLVAFDCTDEVFSVSRVSYLVNMPANAQVTIELKPETAATKTLDYSGTNVEIQPVSAPSIVL